MTQRSGRGGGPVPKPPKIKALEGTARADRDRPMAELPPGAPPCPPELDPDAARIWNEVVPQLMEIGTLGKADGGVLRRYCTLLSRADALDKLAAETPLVEGRTGLRANPAGVEARKLTPVIEKLATDLGLHYAARARTGAPATPQDEEAKARREAAEKFLFGRGTFQVVQGGKT